MLFAFQAILAYAGMQFARSAEKSIAERKKIAELKVFPDGMNFFYSPFAPIVFCAAVFFPMALLLSISDTSQTGILLAVIFLVFTIICGVAILKTKKPAITLSQSGYQHEGQSFPWHSVEEITTTGAKMRMNLIVLHKKGIDGKRERTVVNLFFVKEPYLLEYMEAYIAAFGEMLSDSSRRKQFSKGHDE